MFTNQRYCKQWNDRYAGKPAFTAVDRKGYLVGAIFDRNYRSHRIIWKMVYGTDPDQIDHVDGNRTNNRLKNLRDVSGRQNQLNMGRGKANKSGVVGVCWDKQRKRWTATITVNRKTVNLGRFVDKDDAIAARRQAEIDHGFHPNNRR